MIQVSAPMRRYALADQADVFRGAHEGDGDGVHAIVDCELQVLFVLGGQRRHAHRDAGQIDALVLAQHAAVDDLALRVLPVNGQHVQLNQSVGEQNARPRLQIFRQRGKGGGDESIGAGDIAGSNGEPLSRLKLHRDAVLQPAGADLGSLQIAQDTDRLAFFGRDLTHHLDQLELFRLGAVGEVKPGDIEAGADQFAEDRFVVTGGAKRSDNLGPAALVRGKGIARFHQGKTHSSPILRSRRRYSEITIGETAIRASSMLNSTRTRAVKV